MTLALGKRKRRAELNEEINDQENSTKDQEQAYLQALLRKNFEEQFEPLPETHHEGVTAAHDEDEDLSDESEEHWGGLSDEDGHTAELVQHTTYRTARPEMTKEEYRTFMTSKPPSSSRDSWSRAKQKAPDDPDASTDSANLKKDIALQRLLKESHLFSPQDRGGVSSLVHSGANRHKALDMRLQDMGSKTSIFRQEKMPLAQRKGIVKKAAEREEGRRKAAFENGIVLEKAKGKKRADNKRERGIGAPAVGRFQGGTLKLSRKDFASIEGPRKKTVGGKGGKKRRV